MARYHDWPERLYDVIKEANGKKFKWGKHDCALFICNCILAINGDDYAREFREKYKSARGADGALKKIGKVNTLMELCDSKADRVEISHAKRGDIAAFETDSGLALGVVTGDRVTFLSRKSGILSLPLSNCVCAWSVN